MQGLLERSLCGNGLYTKGPGMGYLVSRCVSKGGRARMSSVEVTKHTWVCLCGDYTIKRAHKHVTTYYMQLTGFRVFAAVCAALVTLKSWYYLQRHAMTFREK